MRQLADVSGFVLGGRLDKQMGDPGGSLPPEGEAPPKNKLRLATGREVKGTWQGLALGNGYCWFRTRRQNPNSVLTLLQQLAWCTLYDEKHSTPGGGSPDPIHWHQGLSSKGHRT